MYQRQLLTSQNSAMQLRKRGRSELMTESSAPAHTALVSGIVCRAFLHAVAVVLQYFLD